MDVRQRQRGEPLGAARSGGAATGLITTGIDAAGAALAGGATGPFPPGLIISDPWKEMDPLAWTEFDSKLDRMFSRLDRLWEQGVLPQSFSWK